MATPVNVAAPQIAPQVFVSNTSNPRGMNVKAISGLGKKIVKLCIFMRFFSR